MTDAQNLRTPWHVLLGITLERVFEGSGEVRTEVQLSREPSRIDALLIRGQPPPEQEPPLLHSLSRRLGEREGEYLLYPFSRQFLEDPGRVVSRLHGRERALYQSVWQQVLRTRKRWHMEAMKDSEVFTEIEQEGWEGILELLSPELRLKGLKPEERLRGLQPEERLHGLTPEEKRRLKELLESEE